MKNSNIPPLVGRIFAYSLVCALSALPILNVKVWEAILSQFESNNNNNKRYIFVFRSRRTSWNTFIGELICLYERKICITYICRHVCHKNHQRTQTRHLNPLSPLIPIQPPSPHPLTVSPPLPPNNLIIPDLGSSSRTYLANLVLLHLCCVASNILHMLSLLCW